MDIKQPTSKSERLLRTYSSSEDQGKKGMLLRFRSLVEKPTMGAEKLYSIKQQLLRSTSILRHRSPTFTNGLDLNSMSVPPTLKTASLDRRKDMPKLNPVKTPEDQSSMTSSERSNQNETDSAGDSKVSEAPRENNNIATNESGDGDQVFSSEQEDRGRTDSVDSGSESENQGKDMDRTLDADVDDHELFEQNNEEIKTTIGSKGIVLI